MWSRDATRPEWFQATQARHLPLFLLAILRDCPLRNDWKGQVMKPDDYAEWLRANATPRSMAQAGEQSFHPIRLRGMPCGERRQLRDLPWSGRFGKHCQAARPAKHRQMDEDFIRQMHRKSGFLPVANYPQIMPTFSGQVGRGTDPAIACLYQVARWDGRDKIMP